MYYKIIKLRSEAYIYVYIESAYVQSWYVDIIWLIMLMVLETIFWGVCLKLRAEMMDIVYYVFLHLLLSFVVLFQLNIVFNKHQSIEYIFITPPLNIKTNQYNTYWERNFGMTIGLYVLLNLDALLCFLNSNWKLYFSFILIYIFKHIV